MNADELAAWERFAAAAVTGLTMNRLAPFEQTAESAARIADAVLFEWRERRRPATRPPGAVFNLEAESRKAQAAYLADRDAATPFQVRQG